MKRIFRAIKRFLGFATDNLEELGLDKIKAVRLILEGGRAIGFWDQYGQYHEIEKGKSVEDYI